MPGYLLDTNIIRYWFDGAAGQFPTVQANAEMRGADSPLYVSVITLGEIEYGHAIHPEGASKERDKYIDFLRRRLPQKLDISRHTVEPYGRLRAHLALKFPPPGGWKNGKRRAEQMYDPVAARELGIDENDLWIVAQAIERNLVLVTGDKMTRIRDAVSAIEPRFLIEDWTSTPTNGGG